MNMLSLLTSISLSGYGLAFGIISLIVAIPYVLLRKSGEEAAPPSPEGVGERSTAEAESGGGGAEVPSEIVAAAIAAAVYVHTARRRAVQVSTGFVGVSDPLGRDRWRASARLIESSAYERGWGRR